MNINLTSKNVSYDSNGLGYHFGGHFNSNAQVLSFNIDIMDPNNIDNILTLFNDEFKPAIIASIQNDIIPAASIEPEEEQEPTDSDIPKEEENVEGGNE